MGFLRILVLSLLLAFSFSAYAQGRDDERDARLAEHYAQQGYFEQAAQLYERLFNYKGNELVFYEPYSKALLELKDYITLEKVIRKVWKTAGESPVYLVDLANMYELAGNTKASDKQYNDIVSALPANRYAIEEVAGRLFKYNKVDVAGKVFEKGNQLLKNPYAFAPQQAYIAQVRGDINQLIGIYVGWAANNIEVLPTAQNGLQRALQEDHEYDLLEKLLLRSLQSDRQNAAYPELLVWLYMQRNDFESAFLQARSLDAMNNEDGGRILRLARMANTNKDYETAARAYQYIVNKGIQHMYYLTAMLELINTQRDRITYTTNYAEKELFDLRGSYERFINEYNDNNLNLQASREMAKLEAFYLHRPDSAIAIIERVLERPGTPRNVLNESKLELGDYYLMSGDVWEPVLLYTQVDKDNKGNPLGEEAKFRNAKLSYYKGDYEWAQTQLRILKASTSELISNDAIDLSVFIIDNTTIDTTPEPIMMYANADLLVYQNRLDEALQQLEELMKEYPVHRLEDDVYFLKHRIFFKKKDFVQSAYWLERILNEYPTGILGDNAVFALAELYDNQLDDEEKAKSFYERIILDYNSSVFVVEARKRYRKLRGDSVN
jgi:tetratricopeptide (TPR) repeat protein